ncbi:plasmid mobilization protein [Pedobacter jamesrossensis]|uniref:Plasmid mobilization relaxosome protein MobC n=1 Tax=Pedobacter jamesrossensis TaxID=1908238 RepID=A0ABV8NHM8_9SPHI
MGRPKKNTEDKRRLQVVFKVTDGEYAQLFEMIKYSEKSASEVIRQLVFKERLLKPKTAMVDVQTYIELKRIGNNLNQYVKAVHERKLTNVDQKVLLELKNTFEILTKQIIKPE